MTAHQLPIALLVLSCILSSRMTAGFHVHQSTERVSFTQLKSKNSDRAHIERTLEDAMNNDWRVFRARLVAQEKAEAAQKEYKNESIQTSKKQAKKENEDVETADDKLAKQGQLGEMFAGAISSIFKGQDGKKASAGKRDIFRGDTVGGALPVDDELMYQDPFVSEAELPILMKPRVNIDKHRWAHEISHVEPGCVLIANEKLGGVFHQTIVLIIEHHEATGSTGIVINRYGTTLLDF